MALNKNDRDDTTLVPPQLPPFLTNVFNLKPIVGTPSCEEVKLVHEAVRALNNFLHRPELRDTDLPMELSQHLFDIQMACHRKKYPISVLPNEVIYDPPTLPSYISVELNSITGPPSNQEIASVHNALRISESLANVPSIFDADAHAQLSQHLFDIQFARHVQRSIVKQATHATKTSQSQTASHRNPASTEEGSHLGTHADITAQATIEHKETQHAMPEAVNPPSAAVDPQNPNDIGELCGASGLLVEIRNIGETLKNVNRVIIGFQNSLARGFNSSYCHGHSYGYDLGAHSLMNGFGEVPESHNLPTFQSNSIGAGGYRSTTFSVDTLAEEVVVRYLRFYRIGEEMIEEGEDPKIKSGMMDQAKQLLSKRLFLNR